MREPRCESSAARYTGAFSATVSVLDQSSTDCHFETICESCTYFVTTIEFRPTLQAQRDDAERKGQVGRQKVFEGPLSRLTNEAS